MLPHRAHAIIVRPSELPERLPASLPLVPLLMPISDRHFSFFPFPCGAGLLWRRSAQPQRHYGPRDAEEVAHCSYQAIPSEPTSETGSREKTFDGSTEVLVRPSSCGRALGKCTADFIVHVSCQELQMWEGSSTMTPSKRPSPCRTDLCSSGGRCSERHSPFRHLLDVYDRQRLCCSSSNHCTIRFLSAVGRLLGAGCACATAVAQPVRQGSGLEKQEQTMVVPHHRYAGVGVNQLDRVSDGRPEACFRDGGPRDKSHRPPRLECCSVISSVEPQLRAVTASRRLGDISFTTKPMC